MSLKFLNRMEFIVARLTHKLSHSIFLTNRYLKTPRRLYLNMIISHPGSFHPFPILIISFCVLHISTGDRTAKLYHSNNKEIFEILHFFSADLQLFVSQLLEDTENSVWCQIEVKTNAVQKIPTQLIIYSANDSISSVW